MRWVKALGALVVLAAFVIAPPVLLARYVGNPWPAEGLSLTAPISDSLVIGFLACVVWVLWAQLLVCVVAEAAAAARTGAVDVRVPGVFGFQQHLARTLITAIAIALVAVTATGFRPTAASASPTPAPASRPAHLLSTQLGEQNLNTSGHPHQDQLTQADQNTVMPHHDVVAGRDDTLWSLAERHLGDGERWEEVATLNEGHTMADGIVFHATERIQPGWTISVPGDAPAADTTGVESPATDGEVRVEPGDTLWAIAEDEYDDPTQWPKIWRANKGERFPDGRTFTNPDIIQPGWDLDIPAATPEAGAELEDKPPSHQAPLITPVPQTPQPEPGEQVIPSPAQTPTGVGGDAPAEADQDRPGDGVNEAGVNDAGDGPADRSAADESAGFSAPTWMLTGLTGAGALLAGSLLVALRRHRAGQHRVRLPGRVTAAPDPSLVVAEKSITVAGATGAPAVERVDVILRRLAAEHAETRAPMPRLVAIALTPQVVTLHLDDAAELPSPWVGTDAHLAWAVPADVDPDAVGPHVDDQPAPWPLLVTVGHDAGGGIWLLNLEDRSVAVTGDRAVGHDFARFIAADIAVKPWSREASADLVGVASEVATMNPERLRVHETAELPAGELVADAVRSIDRLADYATDAVSARAHQVDPDSWPARLMIADLAAPEATLDQVRALIGSHPGRSSAGVLLCGPVDDATEIHIDNRRRLSSTLIPKGLTSVGLTSSQALGCAALLAQGDIDTATPDLDADVGWQAWSTATGTLRDEHTIARSTTPYEPSSTLLPADDADYTSVAATTIDDLKALSPHVTDRVRVQVEDADPMLDDDVNDWFASSCDRPRLRWLGPVNVRANGKPLERRMPFYMELLSFLAAHPNGATIDEVSTAFGITPARVRTDINKLRTWLGTSPRTSAPFIPDARDTPGAKDRGGAVYQAVDLLVDVDLFRRLCLRGQARGESGISDLRRALQLVTGRPFDKLRPTGWSWLLEGDRLDHHMVCAIADTAHLVTTHSLHSGDLAQARAATEISLLAAPEEEIPHLDLAAVLKAEGHDQEAARIVADDICNRSDDGDAPMELAARTTQIIDTQQWLHPDQKAIC